ncbi:MAG: ferrous iron transport protein B [Bacteroidetes bacterium]|nr:ferrous iron transport protein B [Bacteroidota bacterium]
MENRTVKVAISGNPNCGKSSIFNRLTGLNQKVTNIPGTTIEAKSGKLVVDGVSVEIIDTPGTYSLQPKSKDEELALEIFHPEYKEKPDVILYIADSANIKRHLFFFSQLADLHIPMILVLNMIDVATFKGMEFDIDRMEKELGIRVLSANARNGDGVDEIKKALIQPQFKPHYSFGTDTLSNHEERYSSIKRLLEKVLTRKSSRELITSKIDPLVTHPVWGYLIFLIVLLLVFQSVFKLAEWPMTQIENAFDWIGNYLMTVLSPGWGRSLLINGIVAGLSGVIVFIPQIAILFFFMAILEDTGYMARVSFIMDKILRGFGLNGKSVVPLLSGAACAIPAIMATRNIENWKDRMITILVTPLMSCSARLPVYTLLISMAVPNTYFFGFVSMKAVALLIMYIIGTVASLLAALVFKFILEQRSVNFFIMELPIYHPPRWKNVWMIVLHKSRSFVYEAGKIIIIVSIVLWFLASFGPGINKPWYQPQTTENLEQSYAGHFGKAIEPVIEPVGFNWKIGIALLTSFAAREVFVGTMSTIYSVDDEENLGHIRDKMMSETRPETGKPVYTLAVIFSLMIFYAFAMQCMSTLAVVYKETGSWKWPAIQFVYMTVLAWLSSFCVFHILS